MTKTDVRATRAGWSQTETKQLFMLASDAQSAGRPLKAVFEAVAARTGRRPNSVRNYYYTRIKESTDGTYTHQRAFRPFTQEEAALLVEEVLAAQSRGESVRSCTLRLAGGDDKAMLRYQNKYRSMLKNSPEAVLQIRAEMERQGKESFDPFSERPARRAGRPKKQQMGLERVYARVLDDLDRVEGLNVQALLSSLGALAKSALRGAGAHPMEPRAEASGDDALKKLSEENEALKGQLLRQQTRVNTLIAYLTQLMRINSEFLSLNSVVKVSNLSSYIRDLETNVRSCERVMLESAR